jgi:tripeptide aminopeptidase
MSLPLRPLPLRFSEDEIADIGRRNLESVIAIDSQSDERCESIPSSAGQRQLSDSLGRFFADLGYRSESDDFANLLVSVPGRRDAPPLALMVHIDTARGTEAVPRLHLLPAWDGQRIPYPDNLQLQVTVDNYPDTREYLGHDLLFGPGRAPVGLDDKLGMSQLMTLAEILAGDPAIDHRPLLLVFRPDEEIGRMAAVEGLAALLAARGVRHGYTVDGLAPFEINTENFNASRARLRFTARPLPPGPRGTARLLNLHIRGCKSHGATARSEGYLNPTVVLARVFADLGPAPDHDIAPLHLASSPSAETDAACVFLLRAEDEAALAEAERRLLDRLDTELRPHAWKGAGLELRDRVAVAPDQPYGDAALQLLAHLKAFLGADGPRPLLSEDSDGHQGYSNPCAIWPFDRGLLLDYRLRDFRREGLAEREAHVRALCAAAEPPVAVEIAPQYENMGPQLEGFPELVERAARAAARIGVTVKRRPIRGGTGVDPFLKLGIGLANLGTGYFAPESEKEFTSRQYLARHVRWLLELVRD